MSQLNTALQPEDRDRNEGSKVTPIKSDYLVLRHLQGEYEQTGRCNHAIIDEIARRAHSGLLIQPKSARQFQAQLQRIDDRLASSIGFLIEAFTASPQENRVIQNCLTTLRRDIEGLVTLARQHQDLENNNPDAGEIQCFDPLTKLVSDVLYYSQALYEFWQGDHLLETFSAPEHYVNLPTIEHYVVPLENAVNCLQDRLLMIVLDQVPGVELEEYI